MLESRTDARRFIEAIHRIELRNRHRVELDDAKTNIEVDTHIHLLDDHRCRLSFTSDADEP